MLEAGFTHEQKNAINILMKNVMDLSFGVLGYFLIGYAIMFGAGQVGFGLSGLPEINEDLGIPSLAFFFFKQHLQQQQQRLLQNSCGTNKAFRLPRCFFSHYGGYLLICGTMDMGRRIFGRSRISRFCREYCCSLSGRMVRSCCCHFYWSTHWAI